MFIFESHGHDGSGVGGRSGSFMFRQCVHLLVMIRIVRVLMDKWIIRCWYQWRQSR